MRIRGVTRTLAPAIRNPEFAIRSQERGFDEHPAR